MMSRDMSGTTPEAVKGQTGRINTHSMLVDGEMVPMHQYVAALEEFYEEHSK